MSAQEDFSEAMNSLTVEVNRVGIKKATEILRAQIPPESPPAIKHLLEWQDRSAKISETETKERILEAYRLGLKDGKQ